jgi:Kef-type K+ transport system membrane component KefB
MNHHELILFFLQLSVILLSALCFGQIARRLHQPVVLGELVGGIVLGPTIFGAFAPTWYIWLFPGVGAPPMAREAVIKIGMLFFLFIAGLEVKIAHLQRQGWSTALTSILGIIVPFGCGFAAVLVFPTLWGPQAHTQTVMFGMFIGAALSISALPVIARILTDLGLLNQELGTVVMVTATINDLIGWSLFAVILSLLVPEDLPVRSVWFTLSTVGGFFVLALGLGKLGSRPVLRWLRGHLPWPGSFIAVIAVVVLLAATLAEAVGIHAFFGTFLVGVGLAQTAEEQHQVYEPIRQLAVSFFAPIYFVSIGLQADFAQHFDLILVFFVILIACLGKIGGASLGARLSGTPLRNALAIGFALNARGAMEIILASIALTYELIDQRVFVALVIMALATSMLSGPAIQRLLRLPPTV